MSADVAAHYAAVEALIPGTVTLYSGIVPDSPSYPYAVLWGDSGTEDGVSLADLPTTLTLRLYVTFAGLTRDSVLVVARNVRAALNRARPVVAGRSVGPLVQRTQQPIQADLNVAVAGYGHPFYAVDQYTLISDPA